MNPTATSPASAAPAATIADLIQAPVAPPAVAAGKGAAFDAILALETLAATISAVDPLAGEAALEELADGETDTDDDTDESEEASAEDPLEFLAGLLSLAAPVPQPRPDVVGGGGDFEGGDDGSAGDQGFGTPKTRELTLPAVAVSAATQPATANEDGNPNPLAGLNAVTGLGDAAADAAARDPEVSSVQGLARAAEWLAPGARPGAAAGQATVATHVRDPRWADDFGNRVAVMVRGGESAASLQLTPVDLGPVEINVTVRDSQASIHFGAAQAETRALLEASLPRLREMLAAQGFNLTDASVSQGFARQHQSSNPGTAGLRDSITPDAEVERVRTLQPLGLLDTYA